MAEQDPYVLLGVRRDAGHEEIHDAYRRLAKLYHPDLHPGDAAAERRFKEVAAAYQRLSDPLERARIDRETAEGDRGDFGAAATRYRADSQRGAPPRAADEPSSFYRDPMFEDPYFALKTGVDIDREEKARSRVRFALVALVLVLTAIYGLSLGGVWGPHATARLSSIRPSQIFFGVFAFFAVGGIMMAAILNWVERRARGGGRDHP